jgi:DNA-binding HxlR family transcriptional regulator
MQPSGLLVRKAYHEVPPKVELFHHAIWKVAG